MKDIIFISDLHLSPERPEIIDLFIHFANEIASTADTLYILGDFLEVWWGDDDPAIGYQGVFDCLAELASIKNTEIFLMHGNRDFMIGNRLAERCHFKIIDDPLKIMIQGRDALLMHGDTLCTDDVQYQQFRQMVRNPQWQQQALSKTLEERLQLAKSIREQSKKSTNEKHEYIMDVNQEATDKAFIDNHVDLMIHGHTHRPAIHHKTINGIDTTRIVLGDWYETGSYLRIKDSSPFALQTYQ
jgi:UDP-2,3-diacylglucosamine hydrolase